MAKALSLLRARPRFRALWLAIALSYTGSGAALTALTLYVQEQQGTGVAIGPLVGGVVFAAIGASAAMWVNAASFACSALLTTRLPRLAPEERQAGEGPEPILASIRAGFRYALASQLTRVLLLSLLFGVAFVAIDEVALVFLLRETLGASAAAYGIVLAAFGAGMIAGSLGILARLHVPASRVYLAGLLLTAIGTLLTGLAPLVVAAGLFQALAGSGNGVIIGAEDTIVQRYVPRHLVGRVFGLVLAAISVGTGVASLLGGVLVDATSPRAAFLVAGAGTLLVTALAAPILRRDHGP